MLKRRGDTKWGLKAISLVKMFLDWAHPRSEPESRPAVLQGLGVQVPRQACALEMNRIHLTILPGPHSVSVALPFGDNWRLSRLSLGPANAKTESRIPIPGHLLFHKKRQNGEGLPCAGPSHLSQI